MNFYLLRASLKTLFGHSKSGKNPIKADVLRHSRATVKVIQR